MSWVLMCAVLCRECCALHKPGEAAIPLNVLLQCSTAASNQAQLLHEQLTTALYNLDQTHAELRTQRCDRLRSLRNSKLTAIPAEDGSDSNGAIPSANPNVTKAAGRWKDTLDANDEVLAWASLHAPVVV